jgi:hypothetical protein
MDSLSHWWRAPHPSLNLILSLLALGLVILFVLFEHAIDWPLWPEAERSAGPDPLAR